MHDLCAASDKKKKKNHFRELCLDFDTFLRVLFSTKILFRFKFHLPHFGSSYYTRRLKVDDFINAAVDCGEARRDWGEERNSCSAPAFLAAR